MERSVANVEAAVSIPVVNGCACGRLACTSWASEAVATWGSAGCARRSLGGGRIAVGAPAAAVGTCGWVNGEMGSLRLEGNAAWESVARVWGSLARSVAVVAPVAVVGTCGFGEIGICAQRPEAGAPQRSVGFAGRALGDGSIAGVVPAVAFSTCGRRCDGVGAQRSAGGAAWRSMGSGGAVRDARVAAAFGTWAGGVTELALRDWRAEPHRDLWDLLVGLAAMEALLVGPLPLHLAPVGGGVMELAPLEGGAALRSIGFACRAPSGGSVAVGTPSVEHVTTQVSVLDSECYVF